MMRPLAILGTCFLLIVSHSETQGSQDKPTGPAQLLTNGRITKIDAKKMILTVRNEAAGADASARPEPREPGRDRYPGGGGYPGGRRRGGVGFPGGGRFPDPDGGGRRTPVPAATDHGKEFKVYVKDETGISDAGKRLSFSNLVVGDRITIQGLPKGKGDDLEASKITLNH